MDVREVGAKRGKLQICNTPFGFPDCSLPAPSAQASATAWTQRSWSRTGGVVALMSYPTIEACISGDGRRLSGVV